MAQVVCILGMHRSGTSLIARLLNQLGVALGPERLIARPAADNQRGFWEHPVFADINEAILTRLGGRWDHPPSCPDGWDADPRLEDLRDRARAAIAGFDGVPVWGWKDPPTALVLPFWQSFLPEPVGYVICLRSPVDVARSLEARNGIEAPTASRLQLRYVADAVRYSDGRRRLFVSYERVLADWPREVRRLANFCGLPIDEGTAQALGETVDASLAHHRATLEELVVDPRVTFPMKVTALASSAAFAASDGPIASETAGAHGTAWFDLFASLARQAEAAQEDFASLQRELTHLESDAAHLRGERDGALREVARLEQTLAER